MQYMQPGAMRRGAVLVRDIMQKLSAWRIVDIKQIEHPTHAAVSELFAEKRLTHVLVMETS
jgi:hypothetical protein